MHIFFLILQKKIVVAVTLNGFSQTKKREAKNVRLIGPATKRVGGWPLRKKSLFKSSKISPKKSPLSTRGGGSLVAGQLKKYFF